MAKNKSTGPDAQVFEVEWQGVKISIPRDSKEFRNLQNLAEKQIEEEFLDERIKKLDAIKAFIRDSFTADDYTALNGFGVYFKFNAQRMMENGCIKASALKIYSRIPKTKADEIVITDMEAEPSETESEGSE